MSWQFRVVSGVLVLAAAGCSGTRESMLEREISQQQVTVTYGDGESRDIQLTRSRTASRAEIEAPRQHVWNSLPDAFEAVGLPLPQLDPVRGLAVVNNFRTSARIGRDRMSTFFDCGRGIAGLNADQRRLAIDIAVAVARTSQGAGTPRGEHVPVELRATAVAFGTEGASTAPLECSSTGALEARIAEELQKHAQQAAGG